MVGRLKSEKKAVSDPALPLPPVPARRNLWVGLGRLGRAWGEALALFVGWRVGLALAAFGSGLLLPGKERGGTAPYTPTGLSYPFERLLGVWSHWDGEWFLYVAQVGYRPGEETSPFFPLYPVLVRVVSVPLLGNYLLAGVLVSAAAAAAVFGLLYGLVAHDFGSALARQTVLYLAVFPTSFFLAALYSESLFLALTLGAFLAARRYRNWWLAGLLVALATLTRNIGLLLLLPLGWELWLELRARSRKGSGAGRESKIASQRSDGEVQSPAFSPAPPQPASPALPFNPRLSFQRLFQFSLLFLLPVLALGLWLFFQAVALGDPLNFVAVQNSPRWNRRAALPWETLVRAWNFVSTPRSGPTGPTGFREDPNLLDLLFWLFLAAIFALALVQTWRRRLPLSYLLFFGIVLLTPLFSPAVKEPLLSFPRFGLLAFPAFVVLAQLGARSRILHYTYLVGGLLFLGILFGRFANWFWVA